MFRLLFLLCLPICLQAQYSTNRNALSLRYHTVNYQFQFDRVLYDRDFSDGIQLEFTHLLKDRILLGIPINLTGARYPIEGNRFAFVEDNYIGLDGIIYYQIVDGKARVPVFTVASIPIVSSSMAERYPPWI